MDFLPLIEQTIAREKFGRSPDGLYEPIRYIMSLGGKRLRPILVLLAHQIYKNDVRSAIVPAVAVEAFHNFTLMHDDIMDRAPLRRGKPTVHKKWDVNTAILSGDVMLVKVYEMLSGLDANLLKEALPLFNRTACEVCEGQQLDMDFERRDKVSESEYLEMIRLKTAVLLGFSLQFGALLAGAPQSDQKSLYAFGTGVGTGFQLMDDLLDVYADKKKFGKQVGGDIIANKKTYLLIKALERAKGRDLKELKYWLSLTRFNKKEKVEAVTALYDRLEIPVLAQKKISGLFRNAFSKLEKLGPDRDVSGLISFSTALMGRQH